MVYEWLLKQLLPYACVLCGKRGTRHLDLCSDCLGRLQRPGLRCPRCALPLPEGTVPGTLCGRCLRRPPAFDHSLAALLYRPPADRLVLDLKFHARLANARVLARLLAGPARRRPRPLALVPVPLHPARQRQRGFNQSLEIARLLGRMLRIPVAAGLCRRIRPTPAQSGLGAGARRRNLQGAFQVTEREVPARLALIDDVMTTGSTLDAMAHSLRKAGATHIEAWVCARTPVDEERSVSARTGDG